MYLSACHTTAGDEESPDDVIHLASVVQFFMIGTMWAVDDGHANEVTSAFYTHVVDASDGLDHMRAAFALRKTMRSVNIPVGQRILYIHTSGCLIFTRFTVQVLCHLRHAGVQNATYLRSLLAYRMREYVRPLSTRVGRNQATIVSP